jgi:phospholipase C
MPAATTRRRTALAGLLLLPVAGLAGGGRPTPVAAASPIQHIVFILQENHSFDNVLGAYCAASRRCHGATTGVLSSGATIALKTAGDHVVQVDHSTSAQVKAEAGGKMNGFNLISGCSAPQYACYSQYQPAQIPNAIALAQGFALSDRTFEDDSVPSWGQHLESVAGTLDGFIGGGTPHQGTKGLLGPGWGCNSGLDTGWKSPTGKTLQVPACVPEPNGFGPYRTSPVQYTPTVMERLDAAGLTWKLYVGLPNGTSGNSSGYGWAVCPTFANCIDTSEANNMVAQSQVISDATAGTLPNWSMVTPTQADSQHNGDSMTIGDNEIGQVVSALEKGPEWSSTAIFLAWDDCGCFYDHVAPPASLGIRVPMIIISPFARAGFTDSSTASFASILAFTESVYGLAPLGSKDATAYDYSNAFNFSQVPHAPVRLTQQPVTPAMLGDTGPADPNDPT